MKNRSIDNTDNSSLLPDILEQIKKKSEEISTSEASIKLLQNLSNPTNLTNPQIINSLSRRNQDRNRFYLPSLKSRRIISSNKSDFIPKKFLVRSTSNIISRNNNQSSSASDPFDFNNYQKLIEEAEKGILEKQEKNRMKKILDKIDRSADEYISLNNERLKDYPIQSNIKKNSIDKSVNYDEIWEKLKSGESLNPKREKKVRINYIKFIPRRQVVEKCNNIRLINFNNRNKSERFKKFVYMKKMEMKSTDNIIQKLENSKDFLSNKYKEEYKSYIRYLNKTFEEESLKTDDILNEKNNLIRDINNLQRQIERIKNTKRIIINWIYLQIQVKERKLKLPIYYKYIIEDNIPYENIKKLNKGKFNLNSNEYYKILNHKKQCLYEDADDFFRDLEEFQMKTLNRLNENLEIFDKEKKLKDELDELKSYNIKMERRYNSAFKQLTEELKYIKKQNENLEQKLCQEKNKKPITRAYKDSILINKLALFANLNSNEKGGKFILRNDKPTIYYITLCLYYIIKLRQYPELEHKKIELDYENSDEYNMLLIFEYAQDVVNILLKEREYYLSNKKFSDEYKRLRAEIDKDANNQRLAIKVEMRKKAENDKIEKFKEKLNKKYYKRMRKIDFDYYRKEKRQKNKSLDINIKRQTKFEDFFYDDFS